VSEWGGIALGGKVMSWLMGFFGLLFVIGLIFYFFTALREERSRPTGGMPNSPG
jgi:hypothetical protein